MRAQRRRFNEWLDKRIPSSGEFTLTQRRIFIFPSRAGVGFLIVIVGLLLAAVNYQNNMLFALTFVLLGLFLVSILHTYSNLSGLTLRSQGAQPTYCGQYAEFKFLLSRSGSRPYHSIHLDWPGTDVSVGSLVDCRETRVSVFVLTDKRGVMPMDRLRVQTWYPLGLMRAWTWLDFNLNCLVYPLPEPVETAFDLSPQLDDSGHYIDRQGNEEFAGFSEYQPGDPLKQVSWINVARGLPVMSKRFASPADRRVWIDWNEFSGADVEERLSRMCFQVIHANEQGIEYGLRLPGKNLAPALSESHRLACLEALALFNEGDVTLVVGDYQIPRTSLASLLLAQVAVLIPHLGRLPVWITVVCLCAGAWRIALFYGRGRFPPTSVRVILVVVGVLGLWISTANLFTLEPLVALLVLAFALKLIELKTRRDMLVVIYIGYAVAGSHFLFGQSILDAVCITIAIICVTGALVSMHQSADHGNLRGALTSAGKLLAQSAPLMLILFVTFPRLEPLWGVPNVGNQGKTGPSDQMSPGDIAQLAKSSDLAFRVTFDGAVPSPEQLYWRGLVFNDFDGRAWRARDDEFNTLSLTLSQMPKPSATDQMQPLSYSVLLEANQQPWLYALPGSLSSTKGVLHRLTSTLVSRKPVTQRFSYDVDSYVSRSRETQLDSIRRATEVKLPSAGNPRTLALARSLRNQFADDAQLVNNVLSMYQTDNFVYTLNPGVLGENSVDEFLFDTKRGFCEHFASSFTFLMRAAGIPARIVVGYQGGERNPFDDYLLIHQYDAHAWTEVWLANKGWTRVDPTAAVAPHRVERGMQSLWEQQQASQSVISSARWRQLAGLRWLRLRWDAVNYSWSKWVVNYTAKRQVDVLKNWLGEIDVWRLMIFVIGGGAAAMLLVAALLFGRRSSRRRDALDKLYARHMRAAARLGLMRDAAEGVRDFADRIAAVRPDLGDSAHKVAASYMALRYDTTALANTGPASTATPAIDPNELLACVR